MPRVAERGRSLYWLDRPAGMATNLVNDRSREKVAYAVAGRSRQWVGAIEPYPAIAYHWWVRWWVEIWPRNRMPIK